jgi:hypothetical protein
MFGGAPAMIVPNRALPHANRRVLEIAMDDLTDMTDEEVFAVSTTMRTCGIPFVGLGGQYGTLRSTGSRRRVDESVPGVQGSVSARLFAMLPANDARANLAKHCLIAIEEHCNDCGRSKSQPRYPDIATGRA